MNAKTIIMKMINNSPTEILKSIVQRRNWHQGRIERRLAAMTKQNVLSGKLSHEKASAILVLLGWEKIKEETWQLIADRDVLIKESASGKKNLKIAVDAIKAIYPEPKKPMEKKIHFSKKKG